MRTHYSVKNWLKIVCILVLLPFSNLVISSYTVLDTASALALIDENGHAEIPNTYTSIGADAFKNSDLLSVTIPDSVTIIGAGAFATTNLTFVTIPASVTEIRDEAFRAFSNCNYDENWNYSCSGNLSELHFSDGSMLTTIGDFAFTDQQLNSVVIPNSVTTIGLEAFKGNNISSLVIGDSITSINSDAFADNPLETLVVGSSVNHIDADAFRGMPINSLILGANVSSIGDEAFNGVSGDVFILKPAHENFNIHNFSGVANIYACDSLDDAGTAQGCEQAYPGETSTKLDRAVALALIDENGHAEIPNTYTSIGTDAFRDSNLLSVTIPDSVISIGDYAFYQSTLNSVTIPASVISIGLNAFRGGYCSSYWMDEDHDHGHDDDHICDQLDEVIFSEGSQLLTIGEGAFSLNKFSSVIIPNSVIEIGNHAFRGNFNLESVTLGSSVMTIGAGAFASTNLTSVTIPASVTEIGSEAFIGSSNCVFEMDWSYSCSGYLTELYFAEGSMLTTIGQAAFFNQQLNSVVIPDSVTTIGSRAFRGNNISLLILGVNVNSIDTSEEYEIRMRGDERYAWIIVDFKIVEVPVLESDSEDEIQEKIAQAKQNFDQQIDKAFNDVNGDVFILKPAHENFDIYNFSSIANVYACDSLNETGTPQGCSDAWPDDGIDVPEWSINVCDNDPSLAECDPCKIDPESCDPCAYDSALCEDPCAQGHIGACDPWFYSSMSCDHFFSAPYSCEQQSDTTSQIIKVTNFPKGILGKTAVLEVSYDTGDSNNQVTGIGMRVHFNSSLLSFKQITNLLEQDIIVNGQGPFNDEDDIDNDPLTDKYIVFGWASLFGNWPNVELPAVLMNIAFDVSDTIDTNTTASTHINFSHTALASGYQFESESYNLELVSASWDFDGNGQADALTDGLMMLRYCFGLRDEMVTASAMATDSPMSSEQVVAEIETALAIADIDNDGEIGALTDGLMLLRYLFGLEGEMITNQAVGPNANRSSHEAIQAYIEGYMPAM